MCASERLLFAIGALPLRRAEVVWQKGFTAAEIVRRKGFTDVCWRSCVAKDEWILHLWAGDGLPGFVDQAVVAIRVRNLESAQMESVRSPPSTKVRNAREPIFQCQPSYIPHQKHRRSLLFNTDSQSLETPENACEPLIDFRC
jgi:hypothetical protein